MAHTREITIGHGKYLVIDLSEPLRENTKVYPGDPKPNKKVFSKIKETGYQHHIYEIGDHNFHPHGDAPKHQNQELQDKGFEVFGLEYCFNRAALVDLSLVSSAREFDGIKYLVEVDGSHLERNLASSDVEAVVIRTGYDKWLEANRPHKPKNIPYLSRGAAQYLASLRNLKVVGIDSITIDACGREQPVHVAHKILKDKLIVESLVHLYEIPKKIFDLQTSPVKIAGATGGPITAYAFIEL